MDNTIYILDARCYSKAWREMHPDSVHLIRYDKGPTGWEFVTIERLDKKKGQQWDDLLQRFIIRRDQGGSSWIVVRRRLGTDKDQVIDFLQLDPVMVQSKLIRLRQDWPAMPR